MKRTRRNQQSGHGWPELFLCILVFWHSFKAQTVHGAGVTIITHGFNGNVTDWIIPMAEKIPEYYRYPGSTNFSCYEIIFLQDSQGIYRPTQSRIAGINPTNSQSGEILVKLDWSQVSVSLSVSTTDIAASITPSLYDTNFIPELGGKALAELPIHLIGHSRGGSVVSEMARILGQHGIWVDHVTTLDPHPVSVPYGDADVYLYQNTLFADNYWQTNPGLTCPNGELIFGAYNRYLSNLQGGYDCSHSDVHLWYHGTIDLNPTTTDTQAYITTTERQTWWTGYESAGTNAGCYYSLIGRGNRFSTAEPAGPGTGRIIDGYNQNWEFGAGVSGNRFALPSNDGSWPNIIKLNITGTNTFAIGETNSLKIFFQCGRTTADASGIQFYLDHDLSPFNSNAILFNQGTLRGTGTNSVFYASFDLTPNPVTASPDIMRSMRR